MITQFHVKTLLIQDAKRHLEGPVDEAIIVLDFCDLMMVVKTGEKLALHFLQRIETRFKGAKNILHMHLVSFRVRTGHMIRVVTKMQYIIHNTDIVWKGLKPLSDSQKFLTNTKPRMLGILAIN